MNNQELEQIIEPLPLFNKVITAKYLDDKKESIDCLVEHRDLGQIPFTANINDADSAEVLELLKTFNIEAYSPPTAAELKAKKDSLRIAEIKTRLLEIDSESIRPLRAIAAGTATEFDTNKLTALETERAALVVELVALNG